MLQAISEYGVGSLGRELSVQLAHRALKSLQVEPVAAFLWATAEYNLDEAVNALQVLLGDVMVWGGTVRRVWDDQGRPARGMVLTVMGGEVQARGGRLEKLPSPTALKEELHLSASSVLFWAMEAMQPRLHRWVRLLSDLPAPMVGGLLGGRFQVGRPTLIGGRTAGKGGAAFMSLEGVRLGLGWSSGWRSSGLWTEISDSGGEWVRRLDDKPAAETLAEVFGPPARQWAYAPLREFVRLYPLGLRRPDGAWDIRAPLHVEADGSLRMTLPVPRGRRAYWMVGDIESAARASEEALAHAAQALEGRSPALALVLVDWAWYYLFTAHEAMVAQRLRRLLDRDVPLVGAYTYGNLVMPEAAHEARLLHNHITVALLAAE